MLPTALRLVLPLLLVLAGPLAGPSAAATSPEIEARITDLIGRMTLEEKVGQLTLVSNDADYDPTHEVTTGQVGAVINYNSTTEVAAVQKLVRRSRLGIPILFGLDILHGYRTITPVPLAETATFNPALAKLAAEQSAREAVGDGLQWTYAPMADLARDPRWGRIVEGFGEDPYLGYVFTKARTEGLRAGGLATGAKHFAGYGAAEGGRDYDETDIPVAKFRDLYLPPFRGAIEGGTETVMSAFNALNGVPATANPWLLQDVLRGELGFDGFVVSDWAGIHELIAHGVARDHAEAARKALLAGVDMDLAGRLYQRHLGDEVRAGRVPEAAVDEAVRRVLRVKFRLGLFERPDVETGMENREILTPEKRETARRLARESIVLLENRGALPVAASARRIALVGSLAGSAIDQLGAHAARGWHDDVITLRRGLEERAKAAGAELVYAPGCEPSCRDASGFDGAVAAAAGADLVVAVLGEPVELTGEAASRARLGLTGRQDELLERLIGTGKPVVLVLMASRPLEITPYVDRVQAVVMSWFLGVEGGPALAEILFGDESPSGRLPVTWMRTVGQLPLTYNRLPSGRPTRADNRFTNGYFDEKVTPLYPFGHGLTYTRFTYEALSLAKDRLGAADHLEAQVRLTNTGTVTAKEVAQLYVRQVVASRSRPVRELKAFEKVELKPGETREVTLRVPVGEIGYHLEDGAYLVEPGPFEVFVGGNADAPLKAGFSVIEELRRAPGARAAVSASGPLRGGNTVR